MTRADRNIHGNATGSAGRSLAHRHAAFSLIELLFVISIIAIIAATAVPKYGRSVARYRADCAARRIAADLALAKSTAKSVSADRVVTFNTVACSYTLAGVRHLDHNSQPYTVTLSDTPYLATLDFADFGGVPQAQFDMYGSAKWSGQVIVRVGEFQHTVVLSREDGSITVQ